MSGKTLTRQGALGLLSTKKVEIVDSRMGPLLFVEPAYGEPISVLLTSEQHDTLCASNAKKLEAAEELVNEWEEYKRRKVLGLLTRLSGDRMNKLARIIQGKE
jgi:hypothetical protein